MAHTKQRMAHDIKRTGLAHFSGQHLSLAPNDPEFSEEDWLAADLARATNKGARLAQANDARALEVQINGSGVLS